MKDGFYIFTQEKCPKCPPFKELAKNFNDCYLIDCGTEEGMKMARLYGVQSTPFVIFIEDDKYTFSTNSLDTFKNKVLLY
jgi:hypothetical protein